MKDNGPVMVYEGSMADVDFLKSMLDANGITAYKWDEAMGNLAPFFTTTAYNKSVRLVVPRNQEADALRVVAEFENNDRGQTD